MLANDQETCLTWAVKEGKKDVVRTLVQRDEVNVNFPNKEVCMIASNMLLLLVVLFLVFVGCCFCVVLLCGSFLCVFVLLCPSFGCSVVRVVLHFILSPIRRLCREKAPYCSHWRRDPWTSSRSFCHVSAARNHACCRSKPTGNLRVDNKTQGWTPRPQPHKLDMDDQSMPSTWPPT